MYQRGDVKCFEKFIFMTIFNSYIRKIFFEYENLLQLAETIH